MDRAAEERRLLRAAADSGPIPLWRLSNPANQAYFDTYAELLRYHERLFRPAPALHYLGKDEITSADGRISGGTWRVVLEQVLSQDAFVDRLTSERDVKHWLLFVGAQAAAAGVAPPRKRPFAKKYLRLQGARRLPEFDDDAGAGTRLGPERRRARLVFFWVLPYLGSERDLLSLFEATDPSDGLDDDWGNRFLDVIAFNARRQADYVPDSLEGVFSLALLSCETLGRRPPKRRRCQ
jgi:hypothetical protein